MEKNVCSENSGYVKKSKGGNSVFCMRDLGVKFDTIQIFFVFFSSYQFTPCLAIMPLRRRGILGMKENEKWIGIPILSRNQEIKLYSWSKDRGIKPDNRWIYRLLLLDKKNVFIVCFVFFSLSKNIIMPTSVM